MLTQFRKRFLYQITLLNSVVRNQLQGPRWLWWTQIDKDVIIGALPLKNLGHLQALTDLKISGILSVVESVEITNHGPFTHPVQPEDWPQQIAQKQLNVPDYASILMDVIKEALQFIEEHRNHGPVYVHCKAGRGRSVVIILCYLLKKHPEWTPDQALEYVQKLRPHICPNKKQLQAVQTYASLRGTKNID